MSRMIIIDDTPENFQLQAENGICVRAWQGDPDDIVLSELLPLLIGKFQSIINHS